DESDPQGSLEAAVAALAPRVTGSFFVRLERRGLHGTLHSSDVERGLGAALWRVLESAGQTPRVTFRDPDLVVAIETLGPRALIARALRTTYPFIRIRGGEEIAARRSPSGASMGSRRSSGGGGGRSARRLRSPLRAPAATGGTRRHSTARTGRGRGAKRNAPR